MPKTDWGNVATDTTTGALTGFTVGGPPGAFIGGAVGAVKGFFGGRKRKAKKRSTMDKKQQQLNDQQYEAINGRGPDADLYNYDPQKANDVFDKNVANRAYKKFEEDLAPRITGNFRSEGLGKSSYVGDALTKLASDIQEDLNGKRTQTLYDLENNTKNAKRKAYEDYQNRTTFDYDKEPQRPDSGFDVGDTTKYFTSGKAANDFLKYAPGGV